ncbi:MAG: hypothetical protein U1F43_31420 [Myxococcota bacterium]
MPRAPSFRLLLSVCLSLCAARCGGDAVTRDTAVAPDAAPDATDDAATDATGDAATTTGDSSDTTSIDVPDAVDAVDTADTAVAPDTVSPDTIEADVPDNRAPSVTAIAVTALGTTPCDALRCDVTAADPDGDPVTLAYAWTVDGAPVVAATGARLDGVSLASGAVVRCLATPSDAGHVGASATAAPFSVSGPALVDADRDGACDAADPCPAAPADDSDHDGSCDDLQLCAALAAVAIAPAAPEAGDALTASVGDYPGRHPRRRDRRLVLTLDGADAAIAAPSVPGDRAARPTWP